jgi:hypothetical protein
MDREIRVESGGEAVQLNPFAERIVANTVLGLVGSLHGVDHSAEIRIVVGPTRSARP